MSWDLTRWASISYDKNAVREALALRGFPNVPIENGKPSCDLPDEELEQIVTDVMRGEDVIPRRKRGRPRKE